MHVQFNNTCIQNFDGMGLIRSYLDINKNGTDSAYKHFLYDDGLHKIFRTQCLWTSSIEN
jgi:hypothetical protein